eukprot:2411221-Alexandrium_andersonii.AAC.1
MGAEAQAGSESPSLRAPPDPCDAPDLIRGGSNARGGESFGHGGVLHTSSRSYGRTEGGPGMGSSQQGPWTCAR